MNLSKMFRDQFNVQEPGTPRATPNETPRQIWLDGGPTEEDTVRVGQAPVCPQCDESMVYRAPAGSLPFWVCPNYDRCHEVLLAEDIEYVARRQDYADKEDAADLDDPDDWLDSTEPWD